MSMFEKRRHHKGESRAHSQHHKYDMRKMASVVNHVHFERQNGFESTKPRGKRTIH